MVLFSRSELKPLLSRIKQNDPELTSLQLSHKRITNKQLIQIADALKTNTRITEIWLTNNHIAEDEKEQTAGSVGYLMSVLESNRSVGEVYLGGNKIGNQGASSIAALLQINSILTDIGLEDNEICDSGARMLADTITHNTMLQTLKLHGNNISEDAILTTINESLKKNRDAAKARFEAEHPELVTHKLKKPEPKKKKKKTKGSSSKSSGSSSRKDRDEKRNSRDDKEGGDKDGSKSRSSKPLSSSCSSDRTKKEHPGVQTQMLFLEESKKKSPPEETKPPAPLASKFKALGLGGVVGGGTKKQDHGGNLNHDGLKTAAFV